MGVSKPPPKLIMKLGIDHIPHGLLADYTISCEHPETKQIGSWLYLGDSHKTGTQISPFFTSFYPFAKWMGANGWTILAGGNTRAIHT